MGTGSPLDPAVETVERASFLDPPASRVGEVIRGALPGGAVKDALSGTWLGHALHPILTDLVIGSFTSATLLDLVGGERSAPASQRLVAVGIGAYVPTALTGASDWADAEATDTGVRRVGVVHAASNALALGLYGASWRARRRGDRGWGAVFAAAGAGVLGAAGHLGGHLSFRQGIGVDQTVFDRGPDDWRPAIEGSELAAGRPTRVVVDETPVLLVRHPNEVHAIHDRCSHRGCSLSEGEFEGEQVVCPCHGSRFDLRDGSLERGPATAPQPVYEVRERDGQVELRLHE